MIASFHLKTFLEKYKCKPYDDFELLEQKVAKETIANSGYLTYEKNNELEAVYCVFSPRGRSQRAELAILASRSLLSPDDLDEIWFQALSLASGHNIQVVGLMLPSDGAISPSVLSEYGFKEDHQIHFIKSNNEVQKWLEKEMAGVPFKGEWGELSEQDIGLVQEMIHEGFPGQAHFQTSLDEFQLMCEQLNPKPRVLKVGDDCVGFVMVSMCENQAGVIDLLGRKPSYRGQGIGPQLLLEAMRVLSQQGAKTFEGFVRVDNSSGLSLYKPFVQDQKSLTFWVKPLGSLHRKD